LAKYRLSLSGRAADERHLAEPSQSQAAKARS
jgi:hypothetical protein